MHSGSKESSPVLLFPTKVDAWIVVVLVAALVFGMVAALASAWNGGPAALVPVFVLIGGAALVALLALPTRYELHPAELVVRSGIIRYRRPFLYIRAVEPSNAMWSAPAWSLDRLWVSCTSGSDLLISPRDKTGFLVALQGRAPHLRWDGDRLVS